MTNFLKRFCCQVPLIYTDGVDESFKTVCPCPYGTRVYKSTRTDGVVCGRAHEGMLYATKTESNFTYTTDSFFDVQIQGDVEYVFSRGACSSTSQGNVICGDYLVNGSGSVSISGSDEQCNDISHHMDPDRYYLVTTQEFSGTHTVTGFEGYTATIDGDDWTYCEGFDENFCNYEAADDCGSGLDIGISYTNPTTTLSGCPTYCWQSSTTTGTNGISFNPCGSYNTYFFSDDTYKQSVKYASVLRNLRVGESYKAILRLQYRYYLNGYTSLNRPSAEANWQEDDPVEISEFTANDIFKVVGGTLNVSSTDFKDQDYSVSIYNYPSYFYDPTTEEWDTDGEVITPTTDMPEASGYQYRIKETFVIQTTTDCPITDD